MSFTLWLTGLSGAGKSTLAFAVRDELISRGMRVEVLDGDEVRKTLSEGLTFSKADRDTNVRRLGFVARLLSRNGVVAIVAAISPYAAARDEVRNSHEAPFIEVFVDCPLDELIRRDTKGLYDKARRGELAGLTGVSAPYEAPAAPDLRIATATLTARQSQARLLSYLESRALVPAGARTS
jgi:adenylyl-sulfate kinase